MTAGGGLELAREVGVLRVADVATLDLLERRGGVDDLVGGDTGDGGAEERARRVAAGLEAGHADVVEALPDLGDVLDLDPVVLDVLAVGDVGGAAREVGADAAEGTQLGRVEQLTVAAHAEHEELVVELLLLEHRGLAAVEARGALGVEAHPAEPAAQVGGVDGGEAALGVDVQDARADVERVVVLLGLLVLVQRLGVAERPLSFAALGTGSSGTADASLGRGGAGAGHQSVSWCSGSRRASYGLRCLRRCGGQGGFDPEGSEPADDTSCCAYDRGPRGDGPRARWSCQQRSWDESHLPDARSTNVNLMS